MGPYANNAPLIVVVGQTASGKSSLSMQLAQRFNGEIIAADSRTVYTGMDVGTAKPTVEDRKAVPHHLLDVVTPDQNFSVAEFQRLAKVAIEDITARGKLPILVGGSGLYVDAVIYNFSFRRSPQADVRRDLQTLSVHKLQNRLAEAGLALPENKSNPRHLIRTLESGGEIPVREDLRPNTLVIGLVKEKQDLELAIKERVGRMIDEGFVEEVKALAEKYGWDVPALQAPGYKAFRMYIAGHISLEEAKQQFIRNDLQYAKRQKTWFKRNKDIIWISKPEESIDLVTTFLNKHYGSTKQV